MDEPRPYYDSIMQGLSQPVLLLSRFAALVAVVSPVVAAQVPDATVVLFGADPSAGPSTTGPVFLEGLSTGADGGWAISGRLDVGQTFSRSALFGDLSPNGGAAQLLRIPADIASWPQMHLLQPSPASGRLAYIESVYPGIGGSLGGGRSVWIDDQLMARSGDPLGTPGRTWRDFRDIVHLADGSSFVRGRFSDAQQTGDCVARYPGPVDLLGSGDVLPGLPSPVTEILHLGVSPDGRHWIARVRFGLNTRDAIVVDGALYDFGGGLGAYQWGPAPDFFTGPGGTFASFGSIAINNGGDAAFTCYVSASGGARGFIVRNRRAVESWLPGTVLESFEAMDARGFVATIREPADVEVSVEALSAAAAGSTIDVDGDGTADPGWALASGSWANALAFSADGTRLYWQGLLAGPSGEEPFVVVRLDRYGAAQPICAGQPNSTGRPARITALGSRAVPGGDLTLRCIELPAASAGMFLVSATSGFQPGAGGSVGDLCLSGSIGRYQQVPFLAGADGRAGLAIDLLSIPQPNGAVSAAAGSTWHFQSWYRDSSMGQPTSNFSDAIRVQLR
ncbi:hypothetical protein Poly30_25090 [Planctomycetes bacterium Poly30]|uniref:Uncharacterized protein n=1 Tax=Saltatorellus ferox TaxID=2528018 RepID=A0A518ESB6_9BACT|nr:hypothetical protein Poly30_25090 [Planctomycetes bacterium Poly30]